VRECSGPRTALRSCFLVALAAPGETPAAGARRSRQFAMRLRRSAHGRVLARVGGDPRAYKYTQTAVPIGRMLLFHMKSIAAFETRTQPCEAGYGGTSVYPCTAIPVLVKYFGR